MRYFDDMNDKFGFGDGECVPHDASVCRQLYCRFLNVLLEKHGSECRIVTYDRPGLHNWCLWQRIPRSVFDGLSENIRNSEEPINDAIEEPVADEGWALALAEACELNLDELVMVRVSTDEKEIVEMLVSIK